MSEATGEIEKEDNVMVIRRIHVRYHLKLDPDQRETAERVHGFHKEYCPVARTIRGCVDISTELETQEL